MKRPVLIFQKDYQHYQTIDAKGWTSPVEVSIRPNGWVHVRYEDDAIVDYPREAFVMIIGAVEA